MAKSKVPVSFAFGRRDRVDPKLAPFGVLKVGKNLRVRKDGRLGTRNGFAPLDMTTRNGELVAFDVHDYRGRLVAFGSDAGDGFPVDLFEFRESIASEPWRGADANGQRVTLNPFTRLREIAGIPQPDDGTFFIDGAIGGGFVCLVYSVNGSYFALVVDAETDQTVHEQLLAATQIVTLRVVYAGGTFYVAQTSSPQFTINIKQFTPGVSTSFSAFVTTPSVANAITAYDICPVANGSTARLAVAFDRGTSSDLSVIVYGSNGVQLGSTIAVASTNTIHIALEADQVDNTINLFTVETATTGQLRTFNFAGTLLDGPTATTSGTQGFTCRLPAMIGFNEHLAVAVTDSNADTIVQFFDVDAHTVTTTTRVRRSVCKSRLVSGQSTGHPLAVIFSALVGPDLTTFDNATNALFYVTDDGVHMTTRDLRTALPYSATSAFNLSRDASTGKICWVTRRDAGTGEGVPVVTLLDFQTTERRQCAEFGGLLYLAGATPSVYDGRFPVTLNFNEQPGIISATSGTGGSLTAGGRYSYVVGWEYTLADGSVIVGPISDPFDATVGVGHSRMTVVVTTPHVPATAMGDALFGANVIAVLYRTEWEPVSGTQGSIFRRSTASAAGNTLSFYGRALTIFDDTSDVALSDEPAVYTQSDRGVLTSPLEHFAPLSCTYLAASEARLLTGGLSREFEVQISKASYLREAFEFSPLSQFFAQASGPVVGVQQLDRVKFVFTTDTILAISGDGPDDVGAGALDPPVEIPTPSGLKDAWSFLEGPDGLWFQLDDTKLFRIPRGGGSPSWEGVDVEDTLLAFPTITGAAKHKRDHLAVFACNAVGLGDARLVVRDFRVEQWFEDTPFMTDGFGVEAITAYGDTLAYVSGGVVMVQSASSFGDGGVDLFIDTQVRTHPLYPFGVGGYGQIYELLFTGEYRGDCRLEARVSYDDGLTFTGLTDFDLVGLTPGQTVQRKWTLPQDVTSSVIVELSCSESPDPDAVSPSEGVVYNQLDLLVEPEAGLRELTAAEMA